MELALPRVQQRPNSYSPAPLFLASLATLKYSYTLDHRSVIARGEVRDLHHHPVMAQTGCQSQRYPKLPW